VQRARVPGDFLGRLTQEIHRIELFPQALMRSLGKREIAHQTHRLLLTLRNDALRHQRFVTRQQEAPGGLEQLFEQLPFQAFQTFGLVPRMSATVNR
jgi:hypothetical protein